MIDQKRPLEGLSVLRVAVVRCRRGSFRFRIGAWVEGPWRGCTFSRNHLGTWGPMKDLSSYPLHYYRNTEIHFVLRKTLLQDYSRPLCRRICHPYSFETKIFLLFIYTARIFFLFFFLRWKIADFTLFFDCSLHFYKKKKKLF